MKKIGIIGGTFDPIHNGHIKLATQALVEYGLDFVFVMPAKRNPFKLNKEVTNDHDRLEMIKLVIKDRPFLCLLDDEIKGEEVSYTYDTMTRLKADLVDCQLYFILGLDSLLSLEHWYRGPELLQMLSFIVSVRPGYDADKIDSTIKRYKELYDAEILVIKDEMPDVSSTKIREMYKRGESISHMVPPEVERYISEHEIY